MTQVDVSPRAGGKTYRALQVMKHNHEMVMVCESMQGADNCYKTAKAMGFDIDRSRFLSPDQALSTRSGEDRSHKRAYVDNAELILARLFGMNIAHMSVTGAPPLAVGHLVRLAYDKPSGRWWTVRALDSRFVILTRQAEFHAKGTSQYTIIDWERGVRGPCNLIGQGWDIDDPDGPESLLRALNYHVEVSQRLTAGEKIVTLTETSTEVSYRNNVPIEILEVRS